MLSKFGDGSKLSIVYEDIQTYICWALGDGKRNKYIYARYPVCREACGNGEVVV